MLPPPSGLVNFLTDFGLSDPYVGIMHGMAKREHRRAEIVDLCHAGPPQATRVGALFPGAAMGRFPPGTVHVAVVDPGVGTDRRLIGVAAHECYWLAPNNGPLSHVVAGADNVLTSVTLVQGWISSPNAIGCREVGSDSSSRPSIDEQRPPEPSHRGGSSLSRSHQSHRGATSR